MIKQVDFVIVQADLDDFLAFAEQQGFQTVPQFTEPDTIPPARRPTAAKPKSHSNIYLLPAAFTSAEAFYEDVTSDVAMLMVDVSSVIELRPIRASRTKPTEGYIYVDQNPKDSLAATTMKAYEVLARYLKKWPKTDDGFHIGPHAAAVIEAEKRKAT